MYRYVGATCSKCKDTVNGVRQLERNRRGRDKSGTKPRQNRDETAEETTFEWHRAQNVEGVYGTRKTRCIRVVLSRRPQRECLRRWLSWNGKREKREQIEWRAQRERARNGRSTGRVVAFQSETTEPWSLFFSFRFSFVQVALLFAAKPDRPTRSCLYNVMACASIVLVASSLRDSLSAFVWHFITPLDCRIKHPAKGISTLAACTAAFVALSPLRLFPRRLRRTFVADEIIFAPTFCTRLVRHSSKKTRYPETFLCFSVCFLEAGSAEWSRRGAASSPASLSIDDAFSNPRGQTGKGTRSRRLYGIMAGGRRPTSLSGDRRLQSTSTYTVSRYTRG